MQKHVYTVRFCKLDGNGTELFWSSYKAGKNVV